MIKSDNSVLAYMLQVWKQVHGNLPIRYRFAGQELQWRLGSSIIATMNYVPPPPFFENHDYRSRHVLVEMMSNYLLPGKKLGVLSLLGILYIHQASELWAVDLLSGGLGLARFLKHESILKGSLPQSSPCALMRVSVNQKRVRELVENPKNLKRILKSS